MIKTIVLKFIDVWNLIFGIGSKKWFWLLTSIKIEYWRRLSICLNSFWNTFDGKAKLQTGNGKTVSLTQMQLERFGWNEHLNIGTRHYKQRVLVLLFMMSKTDQNKNRHLRIKRDSCDIPETEKETEVVRKEQSKECLVWYLDGKNRCHSKEIPSEWEAICQEQNIKEKIWEPKKKK